jgi:hypothetical protein
MTNRHLTMTNRHLTIGDCNGDIILVGGFNHLEKYESQWEGLSHVLWKIKNVPKHQPDLHTILIQPLS